MALRNKNSILIILLRSLYITIAQWVKAHAGLVTWVKPLGPIWQEERELTPHKLSTDFYKQSVTCALSTLSVCVSLPHTHTQIKMCQSFKKRPFILLVPVFCLHTVYISAPCACNTHRGQRRISEPLELELQMAVNSHVGAGKWSQVLCKSSKYS